MGQKCEGNCGLWVLNTVYDKSDHCFPGQNGVWVKIQHFWPLNDSEKVSRKSF